MVKNISVQYIQKKSIHVLDRKKINFMPEFEKFLNFEKMV